MARKISFINYQGGVGKTSLIVNTAAALGLPVALVIAGAGPSRDRRWQFPRPPPPPARAV